MEGTQNNKYPELNTVQFHQHEYIMVLHEAPNLIETIEHKALGLVHSVERIMLRT